MADTRVLDVDGVLMALLPALGPRGGLGGPRALLKWAGTYPLKVGLATLEFLDAAGRRVEHWDAPFGLAAGTALGAISSHVLHDDRDLPPAAATQRWRLNDWTLTVPAREPDASWTGLVLVCLPLLLPLAEDPHLIAGLVNTGDTPLDMAAGVQGAVWWEDGIARPSATGGHWDGQYLLRPGHTATRRFRLADFPGAATTGAHEVALEMLGRRSAAQRVRWHGTPWTPPERR